MAIQSKDAKEFFGERSVRLGSEDRRVITNDGLRFVLRSLKCSVNRNHGFEDLIGGEMLIDLINADLRHRCAPVNLIDQEPKEFEIWIAVDANIVDEINGF